MSHNFQKPKHLGLTIVIPAFNEESRIGPTLDGYINHFSDLAFGDFELIVVLNGCVDGTKNVIQRMSQNHTQIRIIEFVEPLGKGGAIVEGFAVARGNYLLFVDADNMVDAVEAGKIIDALKYSDIAIGDRFRGQQVGGSRSLIRWSISLFNRIWTLAFLNIPYKDTQCGAKAFKATAWAEIAPQIKERHWAFDLDVIAQARATGLSIQEIPVRWSHMAEGSKVRPFIDVPKTFIATFGIRRRAAKTKISRSAQ